MVDNFLSAGTQSEEDELPSPYGTGPSNRASEQRPDPVADYGSEYGGSYEYSERSREPSGDRPRESERSRELAERSRELAEQARALSERRPEPEHGGDSGRPSYLPKLPSPPGPPPLPRSGGPYGEGSALGDGSPFAPAPPSYGPQGGPPYGKPNGPSARMQPAPTGTPNGPGSAGPGPAGPAPGGPGASGNTSRAGAAGPGGGAPGQGPGGAGVPGQGMAGPRPGGGSTAQGPAFAPAAPGGTPYNPAQNGLREGTPPPNGLTGPAGANGPGAIQPGGGSGSAGSAGMSGGAFMSGGASGPAVPPGAEDVPVVSQARRAAGRRAAPQAVGPETPSANEPTIAVPSTGRPNYGGHAAPGPVDQASRMPESAPAATPSAPGQVSGEPARSGTPAGFPGPAEGESLPAAQAGGPAPATASTSSAGSAAASGSATAGSASGTAAPRSRAARRTRVHHLREMKHRGEKWAMLTAYDQYTAEIFDQAGIPVLLVGDSAANNVYGYESTLRVTVDELIPLSRAVATAAQRALVVADLPFGSYQATPEQAFHTAVRFMKEAGVHAVKLEGGRSVVPQVQLLTQSGIPVMAHIGFTPQSEHGLGGYRVQGRGEQAAALIEDAEALAEAGAFAVVLEMVPGDVAAEVTKRIPIPTIGIGAGRDCDAQVLVWQDMAGFRSGPMPRFVKQYADLRGVLTGAAAAFAADVAAGSFPADEHTF
ncbi:3-methyl-2-oxobutanoate hydroxymethyltransferase [Kribbella deserti]|uniref:3-methyl-2-oxobutanoate hydroxymethyltransferase n=1 Tax=Kribbella deserti TaxID=1926257 RepID=UPI00406BC24A